LSIVLTGGTGTASAVLAAGAVVTTYLLGREVLSERRTAAVAAVLFALSPLVVFQSAFLLPYLPVLVLVELALIGVLRGVRGGRPRPMVGAGLALGVAFATRPFDMLLFLLPVAVWLLWTQPGRRWWTVRWLAAGLALPAALLLAFDAAATGRPFTLPFALLEPKDTLGFGVRKLYPSDGRHDFGIVDGLSGVGEHLWLLGGWAFGGAVLAVLAIVAVARRRVAGAATALGAGALLMLVGYIGFWGVWNAAVLWGGIRYVGPFYVLPVVLPLVLLGAQGLVDLLRWRPAAGGVAVAGAAALSGVVLAGALPANVTFTDNDRDLSRMVRAAAPRSLVLAAPDPLFLMHPSAVTSNPPQPGGRAVYALAHGVDDFAVLASHPDRTPFLLRFAGGYNRSPHGKASVRLDQLTLRTGPDVPLRVSVRAPGRIESAWLTVSSGASTTLYAIEAGRTSEATVLVGPTGVTVSGVGPALAVEANPTVTSTLTVALRTRQREGARVRTVDRQAVPVRHAPDGSGVEVIAPLRTVGLEGNGPAPAVRVLAG
jgi:hypothetical protein